MTITPPVIMIAALVMIVSLTPALSRLRERGTFESLSRRTG